jgi:hypothetical protein
MSVVRRLEQKIYDKIEEFSPEKPTFHLYQEGHRYILRLSYGRNGNFCTAGRWYALVRSLPHPVRYSTFQQCIQKKKGHQTDCMAGFRWLTPELGMDARHVLDCLWVAYASTGQKWGQTPLPLYLQKRVERLQAREEEK